MKPRALVALTLVAASGCASSPGSEAGASLRWRFREGDRYSIRIVNVTEGDPRHAGRSDLEAILSVSQVAPAGVARATYQLVRMKGAGFHFEGGRIQQRLVGGDEDPQKLEAELAAPIEVDLLPTGYLQLRSQGPESYGWWRYATYAVLWPLGAPLPEIAGSSAWTASLQAAHCDRLEISMSATRSGGRRILKGATTPQAEERHKIRASVEGTYLPSEGRVSEGRIRIDYSPLGFPLQVDASYVIERR